MNKGERREKGEKGEKRKGKIGGGGILIRNTYKL